MRIFKILILGLLLTSCTKVEKRIRGKVLSHAVTSDGSGNIRYTTIISCKDGYIRDKSGLTFYSVPIGDSVTIVEIDYK